VTDGVTDGVADGATDGDAANEHRADVSFVVIAFNEERAILDTLGAIERLDALGDHEIIVVDDGSTDRTAELVRAHAAARDDVQLVSQGNAGRGAARATGLAAATHELVAMVDADVELPVDWLARCMAELHDGVGAVGGVAVPEGDSTWIHSTFRLDPRPTGLAPVVTGNNLLADRTVITDVGFARELRTAEDVLFVHELEARGYHPTVIPGLVCLHHEDKGLARTLAWMFESGVSATHQLLRFRPIRLPDVALALGAVATVLVSVLVGWPWGVVTLVAWLGAVSTGHVRRSFFVRASPSYAVRWVAACVANTMLLAAYFAGRLCGFVVPNPIARSTRRPS
jgi:Glycosyl transferase family 2